MPKLTVLEPAADRPHQARRRLPGQPAGGGTEPALRRVLLPWMGRQGVGALDRLTNRDLVRLSTELLDEGGARGPLIQRIEDAARAERDKLIVRVLADAGLRVGELVRLRRPDVVEQNRRPYLRVQGKG